MEGKTRCGNHGGKSPGAPIKHGRYCKDVPKRLSFRYEEAIQDAAIISQRDKLAIYEALIAERLQELGDVRSAELWKNAQAAFHELKTAITASDAKALKAALEQLGQIIENGFGAQQKERQLRDLFLESAQIAKVESSLMEAKAQTLTTKEAMALIAVVLAAVKDNVSDPRQRIAIQTAITRAFGR